MIKISKFCNFWAMSTCKTCKESIFHTEFNFKQKIYDLFEEKLKKSNYNFFFVKINADHLSLTTHSPASLYMDCGTHAKKWLVNFLKHAKIRQNRKLSTMDNCKFWKDTQELAKLWLIFGFCLNIMDKEGRNMIPSVPH